MGDLTKDFSRKEFACKCGCGFDDINLIIVQFCQEIRDELGIPLRINSGCRCEQRNADAGSKSKNHIHGNAADLSCDRGHRAIYEAAKRLYHEKGKLKGLELCLLEGSWVHIDVDRPRNYGVLQSLYGLSLFWSEQLTLC